MADCTLCGARWVNAYMGCSRPGCNDFILGTESNEWPVALGLSIRRFVRRAEVEGLCGDLREGASLMAEGKYWRGGQLFRAALSRLAAMAVEGE